MKLALLKEELQKDLQINMEILHEEAIRVPALHGKYLGFALDEAGKLAMLKSDLKKLKLQKWNYFLGRGTAAEYAKNPFHLKILKSEVQVYIDADPHIRRIEDMIAAAEATVDYLEGAVRAVSGKQWHIKNAITFLQFKNGVM